MTKPVDSLVNADSHKLTLKWNYSFHKKRVCIADICGLGVILGIRVNLLTSGNTRYNSSFFKEKEEEKKKRKTE